MKICFYKGTKTGLSGVYNRGVRWIESGEYSHCEVLFSNGLSASSSYMDGGVRFKTIDYANKADWVVIDIPWADEKKAMAYFTERIGTPYNLRGNIHFLFGFIRGDSRGEFCSEACAGALGLKNPWQVAPNALANIVALINERYEMNALNFIGDTDPDDNTDNPPDDGTDTGGDTLPPKKPKG